MNPERYITPDGRVLYRADTDRHHLVWKKDWYKTTFEKQQFREMGGLVLRLAIKPHRELHANIEPPIKPNLALMQAIYNFNRRLQTNEPDERLERIMGYLDNVANNSGNSQNRDDAFLLHQNFSQQLPFIKAGLVKPILKPTKEHV